MAAESSVGTNQRFTLDHSSFEKLLAAAWVLQCLQDQLHGPLVEREETSAEPVKIQKEIGTSSPTVQVATEPVLQFPPMLMGIDSQYVVLNARPANNQTLAEPVETRPPLETATLTFDADVKTELKTAEHQNLRWEERPMPTFKWALDGSANLANRKNNNKVWARRPVASFNLRTGFNRTLDAFTKLLPRVRVNLTFRGLRAVAIATPVWLLSLVAALLFLEVWRHASFQSAQAISRPAPPAVTAVVGETSTTKSTTSRPVSTEVRRTNAEPRRSGELPPLEDSHKRITDPAIISAVQQLSRYEIKGLRRRANYGDDSAAFTLGMAYEIGHAVPQNCVEAARWVTTAAEAGNTAAQYNLGLRYRDGDGVPANRTESEKWLRKAAAHRNQPAKLALKMLASR